MIPRRAGVDDPQSHVYRSALGRGAFWKTFPLTAVAFVFSQPQTAPWGWAGSVAIMAGVAALAAWFLLGTTYRVENGTLVLQQLYRRVDIPLTRITAVRPRTAASPRRGPSWPGYFANGTAHIEIGDAVWTVLVSPRDEAAFLAERAAQRQAAATSGRGAERPPACFRAVTRKRHRRFLMTGPILGLTGRYTVEYGRLVVHRRWGSRRIALDTITRGWTGSTTPVSGRTAPRATTSRSAHPPAVPRRLRQTPLATAGTT